ncbi:MAG TPA: SMP-30/gluconolactonase/LRE family protein [Steroidobacteraceae bacterium]|nr:SMP-30/gluconolactonase/LRE family protein [Steroidobacteraceae bacterium]
MSVKTVRYEAGFDDLLDSQQDLVTVVKEIGSAEGPSWNPLTQALLFCSVVPEKLCRWSPREGFSIVRSDSNIAAGTCYDAQWRIVCCEQTTHRIVRMHDDGSGYEVMASHYADLELNGPNDLAVHSDGGIYFSDPNFSRRATLISAMSQTPQPLQGLYRIDPTDKKITLASGDCGNPNGLCFSPDERRVYVADTALSRILLFDVAADRTFSNRRVFATTGGRGRGVPDGIKADAAGNIYCAAQAGVHVFNPAGTRLGIINTPGAADNLCFNLCFGGSDLRQLFLCCLDALYSVRLKVPGAHLLPGVSRAAL